MHGRTFADTRSIVEDRTNRLVRTGGMSDAPKTRSGDVEGRRRIWKCVRPGRVLSDGGPVFQLHISIMLVIYFQTNIVYSKAMLKKCNRVEQ